MNRLSNGKHLYTWTSLTYKELLIAIMSCRIYSCIMEFRRRSSMWLNYYTKTSPAKLNMEEHAVTDSFSVTTELKQTAFSLLFSSFYLTGTVKQHSYKDPKGSSWTLPSFLDLEIAEDIGSLSHRFQDAQLQVNDIESMAKKQVSLLIHWKLNPWE